MSSNTTCECPSRLYCTSCKRFEDDICYCEDPSYNTYWKLMKRCKCVENGVENGVENAVEKENYSVSELSSSNTTCECPSRLYCTSCNRFEDDICYCEDPASNTNWISMKRCECVKNSSVSKSEN